MTSRPATLVAVTGAVLAIGFALQMLLWSRQWIYGDQYGLLEPAVAYLASGELAPFSKTMSGGGRIPGALLQLLIAAPLRLWADFRAPALLMGISQVAAVLVLLAVVVAALGPRFAPAFAAVYWLSPWRLYHAGFLWEPGFVLLPAALHLGCCWLLRVEKEERQPAAAPLRSAAVTPQPVRHLAAFGLGAALVGTAQIHASFVLLAVATAILWWRRLVRVPPIALLAGGAAGGLTLIPTLVAFAGGALPRMAPEIDRSMALPALVFGNIAKAALYWFRMGSADIGRRLRQTVWLEPGGGDAAGGWSLQGVLLTVVVALSVASVLVAIYANVRFLRAGGRASGADAAADNARDAAAGAGVAAARSSWLHGYVGVVLVSVVVTAATSPVPVQGWHLLIALHAACIAPAVWLAGALRRGGRAGALGACFVALLALTSLLVGLGHPTYRRPTEEQVRSQDIPAALRPLIPAPAAGNAGTGPG